MSLNSHTTWLHYKTQRMKLAHRVAYLYVCVKTYSHHTVCVLIGMHLRRHHTATHCNIATHGNTLQHTETHLFTPDSAARRDGTKNLQHTAVHCNILQHTATHCNTLQHTATHCNTLTLIYTRRARGVALEVCNSSPCIRRS